MVAMMLRVQERISQVQESMFHLARRGYGLEGNDFDAGVDAIYPKEGRF